VQQNVFVLLCTELHTDNVILFVAMLSEIWKWRWG